MAQNMTEEGTAGRDAAVTRRSLLRAVGAVGAVMAGGGSSWARVVPTCDEYQAPLPVAGYVNPYDPALAIWNLPIVPDWVNKVVRVGSVGAELVASGRTAGYTSQYNPTAMIVNLGNTNGLVGPSDLRQVVYGGYLPGEEGGAPLVSRPLAYKHALPAGTVFVSAGSSVVLPPSSGGLHYFRNLSRRGTTCVCEIWTKAAGRNLKVTEDERGIAEQKVFEWCDSPSLDQGRYPLWVSKPHFIDGLTLMANPWLLLDQEVPAEVGAATVWPHRLMYQSFFQPAGTASGVFTNLISEKSSSVTLFSQVFGHGRLQRYGARADLAAAPWGRPMAPGTFYTPSIDGDRSQSNPPFFGSIQEEQRLAPGRTVATYRYLEPDQNEDGNYPRSIPAYHQYYADTDCLWIGWTYEHMTAS